jgi:hypothetical protein
MSMYRGLLVATALSLLLTAECLAQSRQTFICTGLKGYAAAFGPGMPKAQMEDDGFSGGIFTIAIRSSGTGFGVDLVIVDSSGRSLDARKDGARLTARSLSDSARLIKVDAVYPLAEENYTLFLDRPGFAQLIMTQTKFVFDTWKAAVFVGACTAS